jgi:CRISPR-associated protein Cas6
MMPHGVEHKHEREYVELRFPVLGSTIPADHGFALFSALCHMVPELHGARQIAIAPIRGQLTGEGLIALSSTSRLHLRLPAASMPPYLKLAGRGIDLEGSKARVGVPQIGLISPAAALKARCVTIKGCLEEEPFLESAQHHLERLGVQGELQVGRRRICEVRDKKIVGFECTVRALTDEASLILQAHGIGGRRRFGCGVFLPYRASELHAPLESDARAAGGTGL